ncbi:hypothetical protein [Achromobacter marplatensis]|uniref:hypothetical protein n=1 Tax=Achromobacter marplatensis TaxID=470868 RepID=UPI0028ED65A2|nr:hypothetical protein [Achromobacter marplatensis]
MRKIDINSREYQCWHELGHAVVCIHLGGTVDLVEFLNDQPHAQGMARARCNTNEEIRSHVLCGGFAAELFLLRNQFLPSISEKEIAQIIFKNATKDREMYWGRELQPDEQFTREEDEIFMNHATAVMPIVGTYKSAIQTLVPGLLEAGRLDGKCIQDAMG